MSTTVPETKKCPRCGSVRVQSEFYRNARDGLSPYCKSCTLDYDRIRRAGNAELIARQKADWRRANPELVRAQKSRSHTRHAGKNVRRVADWRKKNPLAHAAQTEIRRARKAGAPGAEYTTTSLVASRMEMFAGRCFYCFDTADTMDHRIPLARGGAHLPSNLVPACRSCNSRKHTKTQFEFIGR